MSRTIAETFRRETKINCSGEARHPVLDGVRARVARVDRGAIVLLFGDGNEAAHRSAVAGQFLVGDYVRFNGASVELEPRTTVLRRRSRDGAEQGIASNVDVVFLAVSANEADRPGLLERLALIGWDSGARPILLVTKSDLLDEASRAAFEADALAFAPGVDWIFVSVVEPEGLTAVVEVIGERGTAVLIGHSGVGKSALISELSGVGLRTGSVRERDGKGRHTTTARQLIQLETGQFIIDAPGVRELGAPESGTAIGSVFHDVESFAQQCRFSDCAHRGDAGCAVTAAVQEGQLDADRVQRFLKLQRETEYERLKAQPARRDKSKEYTRFAREYRRARTGRS